MSTQYDQIGNLYDDAKSIPAARLERPNFQEAVQPWIKGSRVLDLACGTGYYSRSLLNWGAQEVVGVDVSEAMINCAKAASKDGDANIRYLVGDCSQGAKYEGTPFDLVVGNWLLNYAAGHDELLGMFRTIAVNLRSDGHFVGITPPPVDDPREDFKSRGELSYEKYGASIKHIQDVEGGIKNRVILHASPQQVEFEAYHLNKKLYEKSACEAGMKGKLVWREVKARDEWRDQLGDVGPGFWDQSLARPLFGILVIDKQ